MRVDLHLRRRRRRRLTDFVRRRRPRIRHCFRHLRPHRRYHRSSRADDHACGIRGCCHCRRRRHRRRRLHQRRRRRRGRPRLRRFRRPRRRYHRYWLRHLPASAERCPVNPSNTRMCQNETASPAHSQHQRTHTYHVTYEQTDVELLVKN